VASPLATQARPRRQRSVTTADPPLCRDWRGGPGRIRPAWPAHGVRLTAGHTAFAGAMVCRAPDEEGGAACARDVHGGLGPTLAAPDPQSRAASGSQPAAAADERCWARVRKISRRRLATYAAWLQHCARPRLTRLGLVGASARPPRSTAQAPAGYHPSRSAAAVPPFRRSGGGPYRITRRRRRNVSEQKKQRERMKGRE